MKLSELIERLMDIKDSYGDSEVSMMEEHVVEGKVRQFPSKVKDVAHSNRSGTIIIGQEIDFWPEIIGENNED